MKNRFAEIMQIVLRIFAENKTFFLHKGMKRALFTALYDVY